MRRAKKGEALAFLKGVVSNPPDECVTWPYATCKTRGYGRITYEGVTQSAHRLSLSMYLGRELREGMYAAHAPQVCHNPSCINPLHLREATPSENAQDKNLDDTHVRGQRHYRAKLTEAQVLDIYESEGTYRELASHFGVSEANVALIKSGRSWAWLTQINS